MIHPQFAERWSPRAFRNDPIAPAQVADLFEAARRAPSCFNDQPWHFVYGTSPAGHARILATLAPANQTWARNAPLLGVAFARKSFGHDGKPNRWSEFDTGMAAMSLTLQAHHLGLATHFMGGFDEAAALATAGLDPAGWRGLAAFAVGPAGDPESLPEPLRTRERTRSPRKPLEQVAAPIAEQPASAATASPAP